MEPLSAAMIAISSLVATKALEKMGEKVGESLLNKAGSFLAALTQQSPETITTIEKALEEPIYYGDAVVEVESAAQASPKFYQAMQELAAAAETNPPPNLAKFLKKIKEAMEKSHPSYVPTFTQNIEKAINVAQSQTIDQRNSIFNI